MPLKDTPRRLPDHRFSWASLSVSWSTVIDKGSPCFVEPFDVLPEVIFFPMVINFFPDDIRIDELELLPPSFIVIIPELLPPELLPLSPLMLISLELLPPEVELPPLFPPLIDIYFELLPPPPPPKR